MRLKEIQAGNTLLKNNVLLAPMAGYTNFSFRRLELKLGAGFCFTELVSALGTVYGAKGTKELVYSGDDTDKTGVQIFGSDPYYMRKAIEDPVMQSFSLIDINMGCPVPKIYKNGDGSALLTDIKKAECIVKECVKTGKDITVKIRTGIKEGDDIASDFCKMAEDAGAKMVTVHGRVREKYYSGEPDFSAIEKAKNAVSIPVIANGGIFTEKDAEDMMAKTGADGVMIARGATFDPFLIARLTKTDTDMKLKNFIKEQIILSAERIGDKRAAVEFRKFACYLKGKDGMKDIKMKIQSASSVAEVLDIAEKYINF